MAALEWAAMAAVNQGKTCMQYLVSYVSNYHKIRLLSSVLQIPASLSRSVFVRQLIWWSHISKCPVGPSLVPRVSNSRPLKRKKRGRKTRKPGNKVAVGPCHLECGKPLDNFRAHACILQPTGSVIAVACTINAISRGIINQARSVTLVITNIAGSEWKIWNPLVSMWCAEGFNYGIPWTEQ